MASQHISLEVIVARHWESPAFCTGWGCLPGRQAQRGQIRLKEVLSLTKRIEEKKAPCPLYQGFLLGGMKDCLRVLWELDVYLLEPFPQREALKHTLNVREWCFLQGEFCKSFEIPTKPWRVSPVPYTWNSPNPGESGLEVAADFPCTPKVKPRAGRESFALCGCGSTSEREALDRETMKKIFQETASPKKGKCKGRAQKALMIGPPVTNEATNIPGVYASRVTSPNSCVLGRSSWPHSLCTCWLGPLCLWSRQKEGGAGRRKVKVGWTEDGGGGGRVREYGRLPTRQFYPGSAIGLTSSWAFVLVILPEVRGFCLVGWLGAV